MSLLRIDVILAILVPILLWLGARLAIRSLNGRDDDSAVDDLVPFVYQNRFECKDLIFRAPLASRAAPNQRLVQVFGVDNAFTTSDTEYYRHFKRRAENILKMSDERWKALANTARELAVAEMRAGLMGKDNSTILLAPFVQKLVLKLSLHVLFAVPVEDIDDIAAATIADKINVLWVASKSSKEIKSTAADQRLLHAALQRTLPDSEPTGRDNPLNLILPAYETMWRVVLRCFLEVRFRSGSRGLGWQQVLENFLLNPTRASYESTARDPAGVSASFIVDETLRLYPPTRRVYRYFPKTDNTDPELLAADIEFLHHDSQVWGEDALEFKPSRWEDATDESRMAFMPFGAKPFICPAKTDTGPRMIGLFVAALLAAAHGKWQCEATSAEDSIERDGPLELGRDSYSTLTLTKLDT